MQSYAGQRAGTLRYHYDGYDYFRDNRSLVTIATYRCAKRDCGGRAQHSKLSPTEIVVTKQHNHVKDDTKSRSAGLKEALVSRACLEPRTNVSQIFSEECGKHKEAAELLSPTSVKKRMRVLQSRAQFLEVPHSLRSLRDRLAADEEVLQEFGIVKVEGDQTPFLIKDVIVDDEDDGVALVLGTTFMVDNCLKPADSVNVDLYRIDNRQPQCAGLLIISGCHGSHAFPSLFVLLENARLPLLSKVFQSLEEMVTLKRVVTNHNKVLQTALRSVWANVEIEGNYFFFVQRVQSVVSKIGLLQQVPARIRSEVKALVNFVTALPFAKENDFPNVLEQVGEEVSVSVRSHSLVDKFLTIFREEWVTQPNKFAVYGHREKTDDFLKTLHSKLINLKTGIWALLDLLLDLCQNSRQMFGRLSHGLDINVQAPVQYLHDDGRIAEARRLYDGNEITPYQFVKWCRKSIRDFQHIVCEDRKKRRMNRAIQRSCTFDDVQTSSSSESDNDDNESLPDSDSSLWKIGGESDGELNEYGRSQFIQDTQDVQVITPPAAINPVTREPHSCLICISEEASVIALPCKHFLSCEGCKPSLSSNCIRCHNEIVSLLEGVIGT